MQYKGGTKMKYEKPNMELVVLEMVDVITVSAGTETKDDSDTPIIKTPDNWG